MDQVKTYFATDNFTTRRTTGHNMLDPESLMTGAELAAGFTYTNSHRHFDSQSLYDAVVSGDIPADQGPLRAPRVLNAQPALVWGTSAAKSDLMIEAAKRWQLPVLSVSYPDDYKPEAINAMMEQVRRNGIKFLSALYGTEHSI